MNWNFNTALVTELETEQLRLSLLALHRRLVILGPQRNFFILLSFLLAATGMAFYFFPENRLLTTILFTVPAFALHKSYFIDLPASKSVLAFFERHHPELCSWLPGSALLEAKMLYGQKSV